MDKNYFAITDTGKVRDNNEDAFIAEKTTDKDLIIACVIDGVGGYAGGEIASEIARYSIMEHLMQPAGDLTGLMKAAIIKADEEILSEKGKAKEYENMACVLTLALADIPNNRFHYAHVGDTRLYLLRDHTLVKISKDQSFVGFMEDSGRLTEEQAMQHPKRNEINKALGFGNGLSAQEDYIETGTSPFLPGDIMLICSDGLSDLVARQQITEILMLENSLEEKAQRLVQMANENGGKDNITVVLVKNDKESAQHEIVRPAKLKTLLVPDEKPKEPVPVKEADAKPKRSSTVLILSILCLLLLATTAYLLWEKYAAEPAQLPLQQPAPGAMLSDSLQTDSLFTDSLRRDSLKRITDSLAPVSNSTTSPSNN